MSEIDVLMPIRPPAPWLSQTLAGLAAQEHQDWRLVAVIHGESPEVVGALRESGLPIHITHADTTETLSDVLNRGLLDCSAEFIARLDSDDIPLPGRFRSQIESLRANPTCALVVSPAILIDSAGRVLGRRDLPKSRGALRKTLAWKNPIIHPAVMFRKAAIDAAGGYLPCAVNVEDYELWLRLLADHELCIDSAPAIQYRMHVNQISATRWIGVAAASSLLQARLVFGSSIGIPRVITYMQHAVWSSRQFFRSIKRRMSQA